MSAGGGNAIRAGKAFVELVLNDKSFRRGMGIATGIMKQFGQTVTAVGRTMSGIGRMSGAGFATIAASVGYATSELITFDDQMRLVQAVTRGSARDLELYTDKARELGRETSFTAQQAAEMMVVLGRMGLKDENLRNATQVILDLARATDTDLATAAEIAISIMNQMGLRSSDAAVEMANLTRVVDTLVAGTTNTAAKLEDFGVAMSYAGAFAKEFNMDIEDIVAAIGILKSNGLRAEQAGTAFRNMMLGLLGKSAQARKFIEGLGIELTEFGRLRNPLDLMGELGQKLNDLIGTDPAKALNIFRELFGVRGLLGATNVSKSLSSIKDLSSQLRSMTGIGREVARTRDEGPGGSWRFMFSAAKDALIEFGDTVEPIVVRIMDTMKEFFNAVSAFISKNAESIATFGAVVSVVLALGTALIPIGGLIAMLGTAFSAFAANLMSMLTAVAVILPSILSLVSAATAIPALGVALAAIGTTLGAVFTAWSNWDTLVGETKKAFERISKTLSETLQDIIRLIEQGNFAAAMERAALGFRKVMYETLDEIERRIVTLPARLAVGNKQQVGNITGMMASNAKWTWDQGRKFWLEQGSMTTKVTRRVVGAWFGERRRVSRAIDQIDKQVESLMKEPTKKKEKIMSGGGEHPLFAAIRANAQLEMQRRNSEFAIADRQNQMIASQSFLTNQSMLRNVQAAFDDWTRNALFATQGGFGGSGMAPFMTEQKSQTDILAEIEKNTAAMSEALNNTDLLAYE